MASDSITSDLHVVRDEHKPQCLEIQIRDEGHTLGNALRVHLAAKVDQVSFVNYTVRDDVLHLQLTTRMGHLPADVLMAALAELQETAVNLLVSIGKETEKKSPN